MRNPHQTLLTSLCYIRRDDAFEYGSGADRWPAVFYGPDGASEVFGSPLEVPEGWHDHPSKVGDKSAKTEIPGYDEAVAAAERDADAVAVGGTSVCEGDDLNGEGDDLNDGVDLSEPADHKGYALPDIKDIAKDEIKKQLQARKVQFNSNWNEQRLYDLLKDNLDKPADGPAVSKPVDEGNRV